MFSINGIAFIIVNVLKKFAINSLNFDYVHDYPFYHKDVNRYSKMNFYLYEKYEKSLHDLESELNLDLDENMNPAFVRNSHSIF